MFEKYGPESAQKTPCGTQHKAVKLFDLFSAAERSCGVPPRDGRGSLLYCGTVPEMTS
jgi:hypothetical protein